MLDFYKACFLLSFHKNMECSEMRREYLRCADMEAEIIPMIADWAADYLAGDEYDSEAYFQKRFDRWWKGVRADIRAKLED